MVPSWIFDPRPIEIEFTSPRSTQLNHMLEPFSAVTSPIRIAPGATHTSSPRRGRKDPNARIRPAMVLIGSTSMERPRRTFLEMSANRLPEIFGQVESHRISMSSNLPLEDVHEVAPGTNGRSDTEGWMTRNALRNLLRYDEMLAL